MYWSLQNAGIEVLFDERSVSSGEKLKDADLIGLPLRLVISEKTNGQVEMKYRNQKNVSFAARDEVLKKLVK